MRFGLVSGASRSRNRRSAASSDIVASSSPFEVRSVRTSASGDGRAAAWGNVASDVAEEGAPVLLGYFRFTSPEADAVLVRDADGAVENDIVKVVTRPSVSPQPGDNYIQSDDLSRKEKSPLLTFSGGADSTKVIPTFHSFGPVSDTVKAVSDVNLNSANLENNGNDLNSVNSARNIPSINSDLNPHIHSDLNTHINSDLNTNAIDVKDHNQDYSPLTSSFRDSGAGSIQSGDIGSAFLTQLDQNSSFGDLIDPKSIRNEVGHVVKKPHDPDSSRSSLYEFKPPLLDVGTHRDALFFSPNHQRLTYGNDDRNASDATTAIIVTSTNEQRVGVEQQRQQPQFSTFRPPSHRFENGDDKDVNKQIHSEDVQNEVNTVFPTKFASPTTSLDKKRHQDYDFSTPSPTNVEERSLHSSPELRLEDAVGSRSRSLEGRSVDAQLDSRSGSSSGVGGCTSGSVFDPVLAFGDDFGEDDEATSSTSNLSSEGRNPSSTASRSARGRIDALTADSAIIDDDVWAPTTTQELSVDVENENERPSLDLSLLLSDFIFTPVTDRIVANNSSSPPPLPPSIPPSIPSKKSKPQEKVTPITLPSTSLPTPTTPAISSIYSATPTNAEEVIELPFIDGRGAFEIDDGSYGRYLLTSSSSSPPFFTPPPFGPSSAPLPSLQSKHPSSTAAAAAAATSSSAASSAAPAVRTTGSMVMSPPIDAASPARAHAAPTVANGHHHHLIGGKTNFGLNDDDLEHPLKANSATNSFELNHNHLHPFQNGSGGGKMISMNGSGGGGHREIAVDVPAGFKGSKKERPKWPTSDPANNKNKHNNNNNNSEKSGSPSSAKSRNHSPIVRKEAKISQEPTREEQDRIEKHKEELKIRREKEAEIIRQQEFLRNSLRASNKLRALADNLPVSGLVNEAYDEEELDSSGSYRDGSISYVNTLPMRGKLPTSDLNGHAHHAHHAHHAQHRKAGEDGEIEKLKAFVRHLQNQTQSGTFRNPGDLEDVKLLSDLVADESFQKAVKTHEKLSEQLVPGGDVDLIVKSARGVSPEATESIDKTDDMLNELKPWTSRGSSPPAPEARELTQLLMKPHLIALLHAHDGVASEHVVRGGSEPRVGVGERVDPFVSNKDDDHLYDRATQYGEESIKIVRIEKTNEPLGATVKNDGDSVVIGRIVAGGAAEKSGLLHENDEILEINGTDIRGKNVNDVCEFLAEMTGTLTFLIIPASHDPLDGHYHPPPRPTVMPLGGIIHIRALFNYDPEEDIYLPCRELGLSFMRGDILHVVQQSDQYWWQAYREGEEDQSLAGLIPSSHFHDMREKLKRQYIDNAEDEQTQMCACRCRPRKKKRRKKKSGKYSNQKQKNSGASNGIEEEEEEIVLTYEEVGLLQPELDLDFHRDPRHPSSAASAHAQSNILRTIVLIGPENIGCKELREKLIKNEPEKYGAAVSHTSRNRKDGEVNGENFHFISKIQFEIDIKDSRFAEYGQFDKQFYGTTWDSIQAVIDEGRIPVLNINPQFLGTLKGENGDTTYSSSILPYFIFVAPPNIEKMRQMRMRMNQKVDEEELKTIKEDAQEIEVLFGHYFDHVLINDDYEKSYKALTRKVEELNKEPQWVPIDWMSHNPVR